MSKRNAVVQVVQNVTAGTLAFSVVNVGGFTFEVRKFVGEDAYDALNENGKVCILHGAKQKISDRAAIERDRATGRSATPREKFTAMKELADWLAGGGRWLARMGKEALNRAALIQAVAEVRHVTPEVAGTKLAGLSDEILQSFLQHAEIAAVYGRLTAAGGEKAEAMLDEFFS